MAYTGGERESASDAQRLLSFEAAADKNNAEQAPRTAQRSRPDGPLPSLAASIITVHTIPRRRCAYARRPDEPPAHPPQMSLLEEMKRHTEKLAQYRKNEDPRLSFTTPEFREAQRVFSDGLKARPAPRLVVLRRGPCCPHQPQDQRPRADRSSQIVTRRRTEKLWQPCAVWPREALSGVRKGRHSTVSLRAVPPRRHAAALSRHPPPGARSSQWQAPVLTKLEVPVDMAGNPWPLDPTAGAAATAPPVDAARE